jgi:CRP-like cAMP-binding protein
MASSTAEILRTTPVFRTLSEEDRHLFASIGRVRPYPKGTPLFAEGDEADHLYRNESGSEPAESLRHQ